MATLKTIRKRIASTKSTQKITKALQMVAAARLPRAQQRILALRPYATKTSEVLQTIARSMENGGADNDTVHPLLARRQEKKVLFLVVTAERGLCGALNTNVAKLTDRIRAEKEAEGCTTSFVTVGRKGREHVARRHGNIIHSFQRVFERLSVERAREIAQFIVPRFEKGEFDAVYVVFNEFKNRMSQPAVVEKLLPIEPAQHEGTTGASDIVFEPNKGALLTRLIPMYVETTIFRVLLDSQASFFGAQAAAMDAATRNAKDMIGKLTLVYNRARQAAITKELMEIIGGAEALKD